MIQSRKMRMFRSYATKYATITLGALIASVGLELFLIPNNVIDGGIVGISIMANAVTHLGFGTFLILLNLPFLYLGYRQIGKKFAIAVIVAVCLLLFASGEIRQIASVEKRQFGSAEIRQFESIEKSQS